MRVGIMQPYFLPYIGYYQLLNYCDTFVVYDDIEYTKKGWINRNRFQLNGEVRTFSLNLKSASDYLAIRERSLADNFDRSKLLRLVEAAYRKAPCFDELVDFLRPVVLFESNNLFSYLENSIQQACLHLGITTKIVRSSELEIDAGIRGQERVLEICDALSAKQYVNPIGGLDLYDRQSFIDRGIDLKFIKSRLTPYPQGNFEFMPALSVVDQIALCGSEGMKPALVNDFDLKEAE
jgi:hypothetical protein